MLLHSWLTSPLLLRPSPFHRVSGAMTSRARPLVSDASEFTRLRVGSPPKRTVRSSVCRTGLRLPHRPAGAFGRTNWQPHRPATPIALLGNRPDELAFAFADRAHFLGTAGSIARTALDDTVATMLCLELTSAKSSSSRYIIS